MFVVLEGIDGAGTTTTARELVRVLETQDRKVTLTTNPTSGPIGMLLRQTLKHDITLDERGMIGLWVADRWWQIDNVILPALEAGHVVISDRYAYSTWCYQMDLWSPDTMKTLQQGMVVPDLVFVLDIAAEGAADRRSGETKERYDALEAQKLYRDRYRNMATYGAFKLGEEKHFLLDSEVNSPIELAHFMLKRIDGCGKTHSS